MKDFKIEDAIRLLFDKKARRIPEGLNADFCNVNPDFRLERPVLKEEFDYALRVERFCECLDMDMDVISLCRLKSETERLLVLIRENPQIANLAKGVFLPVILPQIMNDDLGTELERYLAGVDKSYSQTFGNRKFYNHRKGTLANQVGIVSESRYGELIERLKQGPVFGINFPNSLQGFSVNAQREQMVALPEGFYPSGLDTVAAMIKYPDILARDYYTPELDLSAFYWQSAASSLDFKALGDELVFSNHDYLADACGDSSGGLFFAP